MLKLSQLNLEEMVKPSPSNTSSQAASPSQSQSSPSPMEGPAGLPPPKKRGRPPGSVNVTHPSSGDNAPTKEKRVVPTDATYETALKPYRWAGRMGCAVYDRGCKLYEVSTLDPKESESLGEALSESAYVYLPDADPLLKLVICLGMITLGRIDEYLDKKKEKEKTLKEEIHNRMMNPKAA